VAARWPLSWRPTSCLHSAAACDQYDTSAVSLLRFTFLHASSCFAALAQPSPTVMARLGHASSPGDGFARSCWTEAYAHRASLLCGQVFLLRVCVLCGVCVSVVNISLIGVIYGSGGSIHLSVAHRQKLALAHRSSPKRVFSAKLKPLALNLAELKVDLPYTAGGPIRLAHMADMPAVLIDTRGLQAPQCVRI